MKQVIDPLNVGPDIRRRRRAQRLTLVALGERSGLTPNYIGVVERRKREPSVSTINALANGLGIAVGELLGDSGPVSRAGLEAGLLFKELSPAAKDTVLRLLHLLVRQDPEEQQG